MASPPRSPHAPPPGPAQTGSGAKPSPAGPAGGWAVADTPSPWSHDKRPSGSPPAPPPGSSSPPGEPPSPKGAPAEKLGSALRRRRTTYGLSLETVANDLCIKASYLEALENDKPEDLPADAYAIGFLRSYAVYLGVEGKSAVERYRREMEGRRRQPQLVLPQPLPEGHAPSFKILLGGAVAALLAYLVWYAFSDTKHAPDSPPPPLGEVTESLPTVVPPPPASLTPPATPPASTVSPSPALPLAVQTPGPPAAAPTVLGGPSVVSTTPAPSPANEPSAPTSVSRVLVQSHEPSWIRIADPQGRAVFERILYPGETYAVPDIPGLRLTTGNGGGTFLRLDGVDLPHLAERGSVVRDVPLDATLLRAFHAPSNTPVP